MCRGNEKKKRKRRSKGGSTMRKNGEKKSTKKSNTANSEYLRCGKSCIQNTCQMAFSQLNQQGRLLNNFSASSQLHKEYFWGHFAMFSFQLKHFMLKCHLNIRVHSLISWRALSHILNRAVPTWFIIIPSCMIKRGLIFNFLKKNLF